MTLLTLRFAYNGALAEVRSGDGARSPWSSPARLPTPDPRRSLPATGRNRAVQGRSPTGPGR